MAADHSHLPNNLALKGIVAGSLVAMLALIGVGRSLASESTDHFTDTAAETAPAAPAPTENVTKREVVYGHLAATGAVDGLYVVNMFEHTPESRVTDYGNYSSLRNLTDSSTLDQAGDAITFAGTGGNFSYEGTLSNTSLPWTIGVDYHLDGAPVDPTDLGGATGSLDLAISTTRNVAVNATYFDNYLLQITLALPTAHTRNIDAGTGQVAMAGSDYTVTFMAMPEADGHFELAADVEDFEMGSMSFAAVPLSFALESPDTDELVSGFEELGDGTDVLAEGAEELADGAGQLADGVDQLAGGAGELADGTAQTAAGADSLSKGTASLAEGSHEIASGTAAVADNIHDLASGLALFEQQLAANADQSEARAAAIGYATPNTSALQSAIASYASAYSAAYTSLFTPEFLAVYRELTADEDADPGAAAAQASRSAAAAAASEAASDGDVLAALSEIGDAAEVIAEEAAETAGQVGGLQGAAEALRTAADNLDALAVGAAELAGGADTLAAGSKDLAGGVSNLADGTESLAEGARRLADGADTFAAGTDETSSGVRELADGVAELSKGTDELTANVRTMPDEVRAQIDEMLSSYDRSDYEPVSFTSGKNNNVKLVQFVLTTDPITAPKADPVPEEEPEQTFLDRLLSLFS